MDIRAIGFDLDDTLYDQRQIYVNTFNTMQSSVIQLDINFEQFNDIFQKYSLIEYNKFINEGKPKEDYKLDRIFSTYKYLNTEISLDQATIFHSLYSYYRDHIKLRDDVSMVLNLLNEKEYTLFVLTNGPGVDQRNKLKSLGIDTWVDKSKYFISEEIGFTKPEKAIFEYVEKELDLKSNEIMYIGDNYEYDILASAKQEWKPIFFNFKNESVNNSIEEVETFKDIYNLLNN